VRGDDGIGGPMSGFNPLDLLLLAFLKNLLCAHDFGIIGESPLSGKAESLPINSHWFSRTVCRRDGRAWDGGRKALIPAGVTIISDGNL
jgi:hypothetical protein